MSKKLQMYNISFIHMHCISWTYLHNQQMSECHDSFASPFTAKTML